MDHRDIDANATSDPQASSSPELEGTKALDGKTLRDALGASCVSLKQHIDLINSLNVFPVPDGDTGTNMYLTMQAALQETDQLETLTVSNVIQSAAHGALMGARGNSGVILSQILRGMAKTLDTKEMLDAISLAAALDEGAKTAYKGVIKPVEGTILTVAREAAKAAEEAAQEYQDLLTVLQKIVQEASASVTRTPSLLPELEQAGVVDAGGQGYLTILQGMLRFLQGDTITEQTLMTDTAQPSLTREEAYGYEALFTLSGQALPVDQIRSTVSSMGNSVLVVGDDQTLRIHVHTGRPGAVIDYAIGMGAISDVTVENLQQQSEDFAAGSSQEPSLPEAAPDEADASGVSFEILSGIAVVAVASGEGLQEVFRTLGASAVVNGGQTTNPSTQELLDALNGLDSSQVILLPNNSNVILAAQQAKALAEKEVRVVPTKTVPQGISALLSFNYQADLDTNADVMEGAMADIQTVEVTTAVRSVPVNGFQVEEGQIIGLLNDELVAAGDEILQVIDDILAKMGAGEYDILTIYYGDKSSEQEAQALAAHIQESYPYPELEVVNGGQPHYQYIISAE
jgi:hypothetical protein